MPEGDAILVVSTLTVQELDEVRTYLASVPEAHIETLQLDTEARGLAEAYIAEGVVSPKMRADAQHIAIATVTRVDVLVSWNFSASSICTESTPMKNKGRRGNRKLAFYR